MDLKQKALEEFLNDKVEKVDQYLYTWRGHYYQVFLRNQISVRGMKHDHFIKYPYGTKIYGIREMSEALLKKYYTQKGRSYS